MNCLQSWPEPIVRVQSLSESGINVIPERYVKRPSDRPMLNSAPTQAAVNIPVIDLKDLSTDEATLARIGSACREWGFFQVVNHGVSHDLIKRTREAWREFFHLPLDVKQAYSNSPTTYEGYGSRLGVVKGATLDWSDYYFLHLLPLPGRDQAKWPAEPPSCRDLTEDYGNALTKLCGTLMKVLSLNLGLEEGILEKSFGGEEVGACVRVNFYPRCPQPDLTLGLSSHSDPGGLTILLPDDDVPGLQVLKDEKWVTVKPIPNAFIVNIGDQIQVLSNANYKSVEHRVIVNPIKERVSLAFFYNPKGDLLIQPAPELVTEDQPALYPAMTYDEYRRFIRTKGPCGKAQVESLKSPR